MPSIDITVAKDDWVEQVLREYGTISSVAEKLNVPPSTVSRWFEPGKDATGRFIATVLNNLPVDFDQAFQTIRRDVPDERVRLRRNFFR